MILFHGTYDMFLEEIFKDGFLDNSKIGDDTKELNNILIEFLNEDIRGNAIYLSNTLEGVNGYDYSLNINTNNLNTNLLFVGDNNIIQKIYNLIYSFPLDNIKKELKILSKEYQKSFISFNNYISNQIEYESTHYPEFLYFGKIKVIMDNEDELYLRELNSFY